MGTLLGAQLNLLPDRVESVERFRMRFPGGQILVPPDPEGRAYGRNPYTGYDRAEHPFLYRGPTPHEVAPLARLVVIGDEAWSLEMVKKRRRIEAGDLVITWEPGQSSPLDTAKIDEGHDVGNVVVQRRIGRRLEDVVHDLSFAFAFHAFHPNAPIHTE